MGQSDAELLEQAVAGDAAALQTLLGRASRQVRGRLQGRIGKQWQAALDIDDVMQVTFLEAFLQIDRLAARDMATFQAWLTRIAENNLRDALKELSRQKRPDPRKRVQPQSLEDSCAVLLEQLGGTSTTPSRHAARGEAAAILKAALRKLPADYAMAVRQYDLEGRAMAEVAAAMERSEGAVHMLRRRAHDRLRELLGSASQFFSRKS